MQILKFLLLLIVILSAQIRADSVFPRYDDGARYAFISDKSSRQIAVIDTFESKFLEHLQLEVIPAEMLVSDFIDLLVYSDVKAPVIHMLDLITRERWSIIMPFVPQSLVFHPDGAKLAVVGTDRIEIIDPLQRQALQTITGFQGPISLNYTTDGYSLFITETNTGKVTQRRDNYQANKQIHFGDGQVISELSLTPDSRIALVSLEKDQKLLVWDVYANKVVEDIQLDGKPWRPYVSGTSEDIIMTTLNNKVYVIDAWTNKIKRELTVGENPRQILTGWLETVGIVASDGGINLFELTGEKPVKHFPTQGDILNMVVVSDTRTLFATQTASSGLFVFDTRALKPAAQVATGLKQPNLIAMGETNTACH